MRKNSSTDKSIEIIIEIKRKELIETGLKHGFSSSQTLIASQQLDDLILQYQKSNQ
ncbi:aspartyl-phosphate phosphatase Spo0E family protein [Niallia sp. XMNu-256]|uniref:aspartyl-phosphate phosphatase Spo0E family protein n=1 Tax=Niallia sp. XMNu-256 TaxID=3082444 RepID=UPI0030D3A471